MQEISWPEPTSFFCETQKILTVEALLERHFLAFYRGVRKPQARQLPMTALGLDELEAAIFGLAGKSAFGFNLIYEADRHRYELSLSPFCTRGDWHGAMLMLAWLGNVCEGMVFTADGEVCTSKQLLSLEPSAIILNQLSHIRDALFASACSPGDPGAAHAILGVNRGVSFTPQTLSAVLEAEDPVETYERCMRRVQQSQS